MRLYYTVNSPYSRKVRVVLAERGIAHEAVPVDLAQPAADFLQANPNRKVPCLVEGPLALFESNLILQYLLQLPGGKLVSDAPPLARSLTRPEHLWEDLLVLETIETLLDSGVIVYGLLRDGVNPEQSGTLRRQLTRIQSELDWLEARVSPDGFVPGQFSIQDLNLAVTLLWLDFRKPAAWRGRPRLEALVKRVAGRASLRATQPAN